MIVKGGFPQIRESVTRRGGVCPGWVVALALALVTAPRAVAWEDFGGLFKGTRAMALSGAFTAIADDEQAIFINPAGLAGIKDTRVKILTVDTELSTDAVDQTLGVILGTSTLMTALTGTNPFAALNDLMGQNIYLRAQAASTFVMPNFGFGLIVDQQVGLLGRNQVYANYDTLFMTTSGVQAGLGFRLYKNKKRRFEIRVGGAGKLVWRRGGYRNVPALDLLQISSLGPAGFAGQTYGGFGMGIGYDLGVQFVKTFKGGLSLMAGSALTDIANTTFGPGINSLPQNWSLGAAGSWDLGGMKATVSYDFQHILDDADMRKKHRLGLEVGLPFLTLYGGLYQSNLTYGFAADLWLVNLTAIYYVEEAGVYIGQNPMGRYLVRFEAKFSF